MNSIVDAVFIAACGTWIGAILFHSGVVAPTTFKGLSGEDAGRFLRALFPKFFVFGLICGALMLASIGIDVAAGAELPTVVATLTVGMFVLQAASLAMVPAINRARDEGEVGRRRFGQLHLINVLLTLIVLAAGCAVLYLSA